MAIRSLVVGPCHWTCDGRSWSVGRVPKYWGFQDECYGQVQEKWGYVGFDIKHRLDWCRTQSFSREFPVSSSRRD